MLINWNLFVCVLYMLKHYSRYKHIYIIMTTDKVMIMYIIFEVSGYNQLISCVCVEHCVYYAIQIIIVVYNLVCLFVTQSVYLLLIQ